MQTLHVTLVFSDGYSQNLHTVLKNLFVYLSHHSVLDFRWHSAYVPAAACSSKTRQWGPNSAGFVWSMFMYHEVHSVCGHTSTGVLLVVIVVSAQHCLQVHAWTWKQSE